MRSFPSSCASAPICTDPNSPSALSPRTAFPTPAALAAARMSALKAARDYKQPSEANLQALQDLAAYSIGTKDLARLRGLTFAQGQRIAELELLDQHVVARDVELVQVLATTREGRILASLPGIGPIPAATIL